MAADAMTTPRTDHDVLRVERLGRAREHILIGLIMAGALVLRLLGVGRGLPYLHEWDEWFQLPPVIKMVLYHTLNPGIFIYGSLYYYLLLPVVYAHFLYLHAAGVIKSFDDVVLTHPLIPGYGWYINLPSFYVWARAATALLGAATVYLTYRLGRAAFGRPVGVLAAALLAVAPGAVYYADTVRVDVPVAFFSTAALLAGLGVLRRGRRRDYLVAGLLAGLAISTKQTAVWVVPALLIAHACNGRRTAFVDGPLGLMIAGIIAGGLLGTPYLLIRPDLVWAGFNAQVGTYGVLALPRPRVYLHHLSFFLAYLLWPTQGGDWYVVPHAGFGLAPGIAAVAGLAVGFRERPRVQAYLVAFPVLLLLFLGRANVYYTRNLAPVLPIAAICAAAGGVWIWQAVTSVRPLPAAGPVWHASWRAAVAAAGIVVLLIGPVRESAALAWWLNRHEDTRTQAVRWLLGHVPRGAGVAFELELAWFLPSLDGLPFRMQWTDRQTPLAWYAKSRIDYAVVSEWNPVNACPTIALVSRPPYLPTVAEEAAFVPNSFPVIDPTVVVIRPRAPCPWAAPLADVIPAGAPAVRLTP
ncbi:MAG TPA: glycosyltransferase family 39 protein [bacterium]|nr:glycosyltransferase family 39 protein [bacterium]